MALSVLEDNLKELKEDVQSMMALVQSQLESVKEALFNFDQDQAEEIIVKDKLINSHDINIDKKIEKILALNSPVAVDLRFVIANVKINSYLERMGDNIKAIAKFVTNVEKPFNKEIIDALRISDIIDGVVDMFEDAEQAYDEENIKHARLIYKKDKLINSINADATDKVMPFLTKANEEEVRAALYLVSTVRKMERIGDLTKNVVEETIFYLDAKVLKHKEKKQKKLSSNA